MSIYKSQDYTDSSKYGRPKDDIPVDQKDERWHRAYCEFIYAADISRNSANFCGDRDKLMMNRAYGAGEQTQDQYKDILIGQPDNEGNRVSYSNINWEIFGIWQKFKLVVINMFMAMNHQPIVSAVDEKSGAEKEQKKWSMWVKAKNKPLFDAVRAKQGLEPEQMEYAPASMEELKLYTDLGGIKLEHEASLEKALNFTDFLSDKEDIKEVLLEDLIDLGIGCCRDYFDAEDRRVKYKYVDPLQLIVIGGGQRKDRKFKKATAFGLFETYTIADIRKMTNLSDDELSKIATKYAGTLGNPRMDNIEENYIQKDGYAYDDFVVPVTDNEFLTIDTVPTEKRVSINRNKVRKAELERGKIKQDGADFYKTVTTGEYRIKVWRRAKWIIGTEHVFDYGLAHMIPRPENTKAKSSFHIYQVPGKPLTQQAKPVIDSLQLSWIQWQDKKANGNYGAIAIEISALEDVKLKGKKVPPLELLKIFGQTRKLIYRATTIGGDWRGQAKPYETLSGTIGEDLAAIAVAIDRDLNSLRDLTGVNEIVASADPDPEVGVGQTQVALATAENSLSHIFRGWTHIYQSVCENAALKIKSIAVYDKEYLGYYKAIGERGIATFKVTKDVKDRQLGIKIQVLPSKQERAKFMGSMQAGLAVGKNGVPVLTMSDIFAVERILDGGASIKEAQLFLAMKEQQRDKAAHEQAIATQNNAAENQGKSDAQKHQQELERIQFEKEAELKAKLAEIEAKKLADIEVARVKGEEDRATALAAPKPEPKPVS